MFKEPCPRRSCVWPLPGWRRQAPEVILGKGPAFVLTCRDARGVQHPSRAKRESANSSCFVYTLLLPRLARSALSDRFDCTKPTRPTPPRIPRWGRSRRLTHVAAPGAPHPVFVLLFALRLEAGTGARCAWRTAHPTSACSGRQSGRGWTATSPFPGQPQRRCLDQDHLLGHHWDGDPRRGSPYIRPTCQALRGRRRWWLAGVASQLRRGGPLRRRTDGGRAGKGRALRA